MPRPSQSKTKKTERISISINKLTHYYLQVIQNTGYAETFSEIIKNLVFEYVQTNRDKIERSPAGDQLRQAEERYKQLVNEVAGDQLDEIDQKYDDKIGRRV